MAKRGTDTETGHPVLARLEKLVDRYSAVRETRASDETPAEVVKTTRVQLRSPLQADAILARLAGVDPGRGDEG